MLIIRLTRIGKKNQPSYRVVLTEKTNPVNGKFIEILGSYSPRLKTKQLKVERIQYWLSKGAQPSDTVHNLFVNEKIISGPKVKAWHPKKKTQEARKVKEAEAAKVAAAEAEVPVTEAAPVEEVKTEVQPAEALVTEEVKEEKPAEEVKAE